MATDPIAEMTNLIGAFGDMEKKVAEAAANHADESVRLKLNAGVAFLQSGKADVEALQSKQQAIETRNQQMKYFWDQEYARRAKVRDEAKAEREKKQKVDAEKLAALEKAKLAEEAVDPKMAMQLRDEILERYGYRIPPEKAGPPLGGVEWKDWLGS